MRAGCFLLLFLLAGCSSGPTLRDYGLAKTRVELADTPFFPQTQFQCGPAALATVLVASGVEVEPETLASHIYIPGRKGSLQPEIIAATRRHDRLPYVLDADLNTLLLEVASGTPVLVMQNLGLDLLPAWHYAVVVGYDSEADTLLLRSATDERLRMSRRRFEATWARADRWAMVAASLSRPPVSAGYTAWLTAASAFAELGIPASAEKAYQAATIRWPDRVVAWQALANARYALGDLPGAEAALRYAIRLAPSVAARNNLAHVLQQRGCAAAAEHELREARGMAGAAPFSDILARTEAAIRADRPAVMGECALSAGGLPLRR